MPLASGVIDEARILLNDSIGSVYPDATIIPLLNKAYVRLQQELADNGVSTTREQTIAIDIPQGSTSIVFGAMAPAPELPANLLYPIELHEKLPGQDDVNYVLMDEKTWVPDVTLVERLRFWSWLGESILFPGANNATVVRIRFWGSLPVVETTADSIPIPDSQAYLASKTAAYGAAFIGANTTKAQMLEGDAQIALDLILSKAVKNRQNQPVRRPPFRSFRKGSNLFWRQT